MPYGVDTIISSSDLSLDRVLGAGLPVLLVFHDQELPQPLLQAMDELASRQTGWLLLVKLGRKDAPEAARRYGVSRFPSLLTLKNGAPLTRQENATPADVRAHAAYLLGEGPLPESRVTAAAPRQPSGKPVAMDEKRFESEVLKSEQPVLVDFWAPWCGPCRMMEPAVEALAREQAGQFKVARVNVDENPGLAARYGALSIPTMLVIKDGREVDRWVGAMPANALRERVKRWLQVQPQAA